MEGGKCVRQIIFRQSNRKDLQNKVNTETLKQTVTHLCIIDCSKGNSYSTLTFVPFFLSDTTRETLTAMVDVQNSSVLDE